MVCGLTLGYLDKERVDFPGTVRVFPMLPLLVGGGGASLYSRPSIGCFVVAHGL